MKTHLVVAWLAALGLGTLGVPAAVVGEETGVDPGLPAYRQVSGIAGNLNSMGSDTLNNLMAYWSEGFRRVYPNVNIQVEGKGSTTAPQALSEGTAQLGPMSREMTQEELDNFERRHGFRPTRIDVAIDCLGVFVHKDNPVRGLTLPQLDAIFSKTRRSGYAAITTWGQVGVTGPWERMPISLYGRNTASGTYGYFKERALFGGDFRDTYREQPGSSSVIQSVGQDRAGIGYSGIGYLTSDVRPVPLAADQQTPPAAPTFANAVEGRYPLARMLHIYVAKRPGEPLPPLIREFITFVLSQEGQELVVKGGYGPLPARVAEAQLGKIE